MFPRCLVFISCWFLSAAFSAAVEEEEEFSAGSEQFQLVPWQTHRGLPDNNVTALAQTIDGFLWVATETALAKFDGEKFTVVNIESALNFSTERIEQLLASRAGALWIRTKTGRIFALRGEEIVRPNRTAPAGPVTALAEDDRGVLWLGLRGGRVEQWRDDQFLGAQTVPGCRPDERLRLVFDPAEEKMWVVAGRAFGTFYGGTWAPQGESSAVRQPLAPSAEGGLYMVEESNGHCAVYQTHGASEETPRIVLPVRMAEIVVAIEDQRRALWLGTREHGVFRIFGGKADRFPQPRTDIPALLEDSEGNIWAGTQGSGLIRLRPRGFAVIPRTKDFGENAVSSVTQDGAGTLWVIHRNEQLLRSRDAAWDPIPLSDARLHLKCVCADPDGSVWVGSWGRGVWRLERGKLTHYTKDDGLASDRVRAFFSPAPGTLWVGTETGLSRFAEGQWKSWGVADGLLAATGR